MPKKDIKPVTLKIRPVETKTEIDERGAFQRQPNRFTTPFGDGPGQLKAEKASTDSFGLAVATGLIVLLSFVNCLGWRMSSQSIR